MSATASTSPIDVRDICRESELPSVKTKDEYLRLNEQITGHLDAFVEKIVDTAEKFETLILPLLDQMQSLLSKRGSSRKLPDLAAVPTWERWFENFEKRLHLDISLRQVQRWLKAYRTEKGEEPRTLDVNVLAKESLRHIESQPHAEKLDSVVRGRIEINAAHRAELIRALKARVKRDSVMIAKLEEGFEPLPIAETGKAHQRLVREQRAKLPDPLLEEKRKLAADFSNARVEQISYNVAKNVVLANEYLGSMGSASHCFGLYFGDYLASVVCFGSVAGTKVAASVCGPEHRSKVIVLVRGATEHWADPPRTSADGKTHSGGAASHLIAKACKLMATGGYPIIVAYSDPAGGEVGQIYSAVNFLYTGMTEGSEVFITPDGKTHNSRQIHGSTRDRRNGEVKYKRTRAEQRQLLIDQGCEFRRLGGKHRYVHFAGDRRTKHMLRKALKWEVMQHPRREGQTIAVNRTVRPVDQVQRLGAQPKSKTRSISSQKAPATSYGGRSDEQIID